MVKRYGNLWDKVVSMENIKEAYLNARRGKSSRHDVIKVDKNPQKYLLKIQKMLINHTYKSSEYRMFTLTDRGKTRTVADIRFYPDRIVHWAIMQVLEPILLSSLIDQTYAAIPKKGAHKALVQLKKYLRNDDAVYCLKMDVKKFFPNINKDILMNKLRRKIKDPDVLDLLSEIIYGYPYSGLPIGNYTSQYLANFYLSDLDHYLKENQHCKYYLRYMEDMIIIGWKKEWLHQLRIKVNIQLDKDGLCLKDNWQIFPIEDRGVDFVGYRTFKNYSLLRTGTKNKMKKASRKLCRKLDSGLELDVHDLGCYSAYNGCLSWCDSYHLRSSTLDLVDEKTRS